MQNDIPQPQPDIPQPQSEIARLLAQIKEEYEAAQQGLYGLAMGCGRHQTIIGKDKHLGELHSQLREHIGDEATPLIVDMLSHPAEHPKTDRPPS